MVKSMAKSFVIISGSMGSGKTSVLGEASDVLTANGVVHAAIDLDAIGAAHLPPGAADHVRCRNLAAICKNYAAEGVAKFLLAGAIENAPDLERIRLAVQADTVVVVRLTARLETMQARVRNAGDRDASVVLCRARRGAGSHPRSGTLGTHHDQQRRATDHTSRP